MDPFAKQALEEYNSDTDTVRRGGLGGKPFWNINSSQFTFVPQFSFPVIPGAKSYRFTAKDEKENTYTFEADSPTASLAPIWKDIPSGMVTLTVEALHSRGAVYLAGARTFYKSAPFPGREALPPRARSYKECALAAFRYVFRDPTTRYWLEHGTPDPNYYHNVYPSKTFSSTISAMLAYASLAPEDAADAIKMATNAADYLLSITYGEDSKLAGLPPTYSFLGLNKKIVDENAPAAEQRKSTLMIIYPAMVGIQYLALEKATGNTKYFDAAKRIADYYKANVLPNGSWYLLVHEDTGLPEQGNCCVHFSVLTFLRGFYERSGDESFHRLEKNYYAYIEKTCLENYNWEGQFEDTALAGYYSNLTHLNADKMIGYIAESMADDPEKLREARELMRFVEDQFVVWGEHAPWNTHRWGDAYWYSPAALEQYLWYVPIDGSTVTVMRAFLDLYQATKEPLLLEKARALGDAITRMQDPENGVIPTHWMDKDCMHTLFNFWINCHIGSAFQMMHLAKVVGEI